jgi:hypothetical protein
LWTVGDVSAMAFSLCLFTAVNVEQTKVVLGYSTSHHLHKR